MAEFSGGSVVKKSHSDPRMGSHQSGMKYSGGGALASIAYL